jgi:hypothetical protein
MKDRLCAAFCEGIQTRDVPAGLAVSTAFAASDGDRIGFYVVRDNANASAATPVPLYRIEDNGLTIPLLEAGGFNLRSGSRSEAVADLLREYNVEIDYDAREFAIEAVPYDEVPAAALRFVAFLLRARDFRLLTESRVATTFREDVGRALRERLVLPNSSNVEITERAAVAPQLEGFPADFVIKVNDRPPVGVFLGTSDARLLEAMVVYMRARYAATVACKVIALIQQEKGLTANVRQQATNELRGGLLYFTSEQKATAIERIAQEASN